MREEPDAFARRVKGVIPVACLRFPSPFQSEAGQDKRQAQLEEWGVRVTRDFDEAVGGDLRTKDVAVPFVADDSDGLRDSLLQVRRFFTTGQVPVDPLDTLEVMDLLDAAQRSFVSKQEEPLSR
jgi:hypothetical protein